MTAVELHADWLADWLPSALADGQDPFSFFMALTGEPYRQVRGRETLAVELAGRRCFIKRHLGVGWAAIVNDALRGHRPVVDARPEVDACSALAAAGLQAPRVLAWGLRGATPATRQSFVVLDELREHESLEDVWRDPALTSRARHRVLSAVADFSRRFHAAGFSHRDYYLCHLWQRRGMERHPVPELLVMDLHRARRFRTLPERYRLRDLAALLYSSFEVPPGKHAVLRFVRRYAGRPLRAEFRERGAFWRAVYRRALILQQRTDRSVYRLAETTDQSFQPCALEAAMARGVVLKQDPPATLVRVNWPPEPEPTPAGTAVIKRYNLLGPGHRLRQSLRPRSRAGRARRAARWFERLGLPTAQVLAAVDERRFGLRQPQFLVLDDLGDATLADVIGDDALAPVGEPLTNLIRLFRRLVIHGLEHGDTKATNLMVVGESFAFIDLDATRRRFGGSARDQARLLKNVVDQPLLRQQLRQRLLWPLD
ncbi:MAG: lipopolysaccharide core heptose(I) kinase RfaP [Pseudomonadota bacterium]